MAVTTIPPPYATQSYVDTTSANVLYRVAATESLICTVNRGMLLLNEVILDGYLKVDGIGRLI